MSARSNDKKIKQLQAEVASLKASGGDAVEASKRLARASNQLRQQNSNDILEAIMGEERARDLRQGYKPNKQDMAAI